MNEIEQHILNRLQKYTTKPVSLHTPIGSVLSEKNMLFFEMDIEKCFWLDMPVSLFSATETPKTLAVTVQEILRNEIS